MTTKTFRNSYLLKIKELKTYFKIADYRNYVLKSCNRRVCEIRITHDFIKCLFEEKS